MFYFKYVYFQALTIEIVNNHTVLDKLETDSQQLFTGVRSRESAAVKSKLAHLRCQWELLCSNAKGHNTALSQNAHRWHHIHENMDILLPWLDKANEYLQNDCGHTASIVDAEAQLSELLVSLFYFMLYQY